jgi:hypothetical protein
MAKFYGQDLRERMSRKSCSAFSIPACSNSLFLRSLVPGAESHKMSIILKYQVLSRIKISTPTRYPLARFV